MEKWHAGALASEPVFCPDGGQSPTPPPRRPWTASFTCPLSPERSRRRYDAVPGLAHRFQEAAFGSVRMTGLQLMLGPAEKPDPIPLLRMEAG